MGRQVVGSLKGPAGDSAYQIAVKHGFTGTEEQWLESLSSGGLIDPITGLPPENVVTAISEAVLADHKNDPDPHPAFEISMLDSYLLGKL